MKNLAALNTALRLGASLRDLPVDSIAVVRWPGSVTEKPYVVRIVDVEVWENTIVLETVTTTTSVVKYNHERYPFSTPPGVPDRFTPGMISEVVGLPEGWAGNPMELLEKTGV